MGDFKKLIAWQLSDALAGDLADIFITGRRRCYPRLRDQLLGAAGSVPDNLAEGSAKRSPVEFSRYIESAYASAKEVQSQLSRARRARIITNDEYDDFEARADRVAKLCYGLMRSGGRGGGTAAPDNRRRKPPP